MSVTKDFNQVDKLIQANQDLVVAAHVAKQHQIRVEERAELPEDEGRVRSAAEEVQEAQVRATDAKRLQPRRHLQAGRPAAEHVRPREPEEDHAEHERHAEDGQRVRDEGCADYG